MITCEKCHKEFRSFTFGIPMMQGVHQIDGVECLRLQLAAMTAERDKAYTDARKWESNSIRLELELAKAQADCAAMRNVVQLFVERGECTDAEEILAKPHSGQPLLDRLGELEHDVDMHKSSSDGIMEARAYLKEHLGIESAWFDDCIRNVVARVLQADKRIAELEAVVSVVTNSIECRIKRMENHAACTEAQQLCNQYIVRELNELRAILAAKGGA